MWLSVWSEVQIVCTWSSSSSSSNSTSIYNDTAIFRLMHGLLIDVC